MKNKIILSAILGTLAMTAQAQSGTNSPYSQYGLGILSDQSQGFNRGMNGLALGLRSSGQINVQNPASYSAVDSLTMLFDLGVSGQVTNFKEGGRKINANNSDFEYAVAAFRLRPHVGFSLGLLPYTNIGYAYSNARTIGMDTEGNISAVSTETHSGSGGLHQAFVGAGWNIVSGLSVGANFSYLWGSYEKSVAVSNSDGTVNTVMKTYQATVHSYKVDFGLQWQQQLKNENALTVGLTCGLGHSLGVDPELVTTVTNPMTSVSTTNTISCHDGLHIPTTFGAGVAFSHGRKFTVGADYTFQKWGSLDYPMLNLSTGNYEMTSGQLADRHKVTVGGEYIPNETSRHFFDRVRYRFGVSYNTPYIKVNGNDGPKECSVSAGFGIPIINSWNNKSFLNISGQWTRSSATSLITENTFRINIGLTFNERWFSKWKVE